MLSDEYLREDQLYTAKGCLKIWKSDPSKSVAKSIGIYSIWGSNANYHKYGELWKEVFKDEPVVLKDICKTYEKYFPKS